MQAWQFAVLTVVSMHTAPEPIATLPDPSQASQVTALPEDKSLEDRLSPEERTEDEDENVPLPVNQRASLFRRAFQAESREEPVEERILSFIRATIAFLH